MFCADRRPGTRAIACRALHVTLDIDISYDRSVENLASLLTTLNNGHARLRNEPQVLPFILEVRTFKNVQNLAPRSFFYGLLLRLPQFT